MKDRCLNVKEYCTNVDAQSMILTLYTLQHVEPTL